MVDTFQSLVRNNGIWQYLRGDSGVFTPAVNRDALVAGTYNPDDYAVPGQWETNRVGIYGLSNLTQSEGGTITFNTLGQTISNMNFLRRVKVTAPDVTFVNCLFQGSPTLNSPVVDCTSSACTNTTFLDCTVTAQAPQWAVSGLKLGAGGFTISRCHIFGVIDGIAHSAVWTNQVNVIQSAINNLALFSPDPGANGGIPDNAGHVDCIQMAGGSLRVYGSSLMAFYDMLRYQANEPPINFGNNNEYHMYGNRYLATLTSPAGSPYQNVIGQPVRQANSCIMMSPDLGPLNHIEIDNSYLDGAPYPINVHSTYTSINTGGGAYWKLTNNHLGMNHRDGIDYKTVICQTAFMPYIEIYGNKDLYDGTYINGDSANPSSSATRTLILKTG